MNEKALMAIGAHADDIELDVGGTLLKYFDLGYRVVYVMATNNMSGNWWKKGADGAITKTVLPYSKIMEQRRIEARAGAAVFEAEPILLEYPQRRYVGHDGAVHEVGFGTDRPPIVPPGMPSILTAHEHAGEVSRVKDLILGHRPEAVLTHGHLGDNMEHIGTCLLVTKAYRKAVEEGYTGMLLYWHDIAATVFRRNYCKWDTHIDVSRLWDRKLNLIALHACQKPDVHRLDYPLWGPACGTERAEVFDIAAEGVPPLYYTAFQIELLKNRCRN